MRGELEKLGSYCANAPGQISGVKVTRIFVEWSSPVHSCSGLGTCRRTKNDVDRVQHARVSYTLKRRTNDQQTVPPLHTYGVVRNVRGSKSEARPRVKSCSYSCVRRTDRGGRHHRRLNFALFFRGRRKKKTGFGHACVMGLQFSTPVFTKAETSQHATAAATLNCPIDCRLCAAYAIRSTCGYIHMLTCGCGITCTTSIGKGCAVKDTLWKLLARHGGTEWVSYRYVDRHDLTISPTCT